MSREKQGCIRILAQETQANLNSTQGPGSAHNGADVASESRASNCTVTPKLDLLFTVLHTLHYTLMEDKSPSVTRHRNLDQQAGYRIT